MTGSLFVPQPAAHYTVQRLMNDLLPALADSLPTIEQLEEILFRH